MKKIVISGIIGDPGLDGAAIRQQLVAANGEDILVEISSPGGYVYDGLEIYGLLRSYSGNVDTHIIGLAASMASYIAMVGKKRTAEASAVLIIHNPAGIVAGDYRAFGEAASYFEGLASHLAAKYSECSSRTIKDIRGLMDAESYFFGEEMKAAGFVHELIGSTPGEKNNVVSLAKSRYYQAAATMSREFKREDLKKAAALIDCKPAAHATGTMSTIDEMIKNDPAGVSRFFHDAYLEGLEAERVRVQAWLVWHDYDPQGVQEAISNGTPFDTAALSRYSNAVNTRGKDYSEADLLEAVLRYSTIRGWVPGSMKQAIN